MRAIRCHAWGEPETLRLETIDPPDLAALCPQGDGVLIATSSAALNFADSLMIKGEYQEKPAFPFSPGLEVAGSVLATGPTVQHIRPGDRVLAIVDHGGFAEQTVARSQDVFVIPPWLDFATACSLPIVYGTAWGGLVWRAHLQAGETLLVHGAAGGVGLAAVEIGKALGARVIASAGGPEKLAIAYKHGADAGIDYRNESIKESCYHLTDGRGADVVFDPVGGSVFMESLRCTSFAGRLIVVGFAGGTIQQIPANHLLVKNIGVLGFYWGAYRRKDPEKVAESYRIMLPWIEEKRLQPHISKRFQLEQAGEALRFILERRSTGKVIITINPSNASK